ncbi:MAG TPA: DNA repair protein RecN [Candidatus Kapabacteria bacterium]|nr:DNA repair protein RecN [Candidatus Kapabacteria bacterium]
MCIVIVVKKSLGEILTTFLFHIVQARISLSEPSFLFTAYYRSNLLHIVLRSLFIKNYALIEEIMVSFERGLSIITGETGAGKSILLDALALVLGERASTDFIRKGAEKAIVEAEFDLSGHKHIIKQIAEAGFDIDNNVLVIRRELTRKGTSRAFINDTPATLQILKHIGELLVDLHGQHEHQSLLYPERHIEFLDEYAGLHDEIEKFENVFDEFAAAKTRYDAILEDKDKSEHERNFLDFQLQEIAAAHPVKNEDVSVASELQKLEHSEELQAAAAELHSLLYENEDSVFGRLSAAEKLLAQLATYDSSFASQINELHTSLESIRELSHTVSRYTEHIESDPARLQELRQRELSLTRLKKKYGPSLDDVLALSNKLTSELGAGGSADELLVELAARLRTLQKKATALALVISEQRQKAAKKFEKQIVAELTTLGLEHASFIVRISSNEKESGKEFDSPVIVNNKICTASRTGIDRAEFFISANKGEEPKPLAKVASGGEVSRIMLAIKTVLSESEQIPVLIFDEIDIGISGRIAQRVGTAMKRLARKHQIIAITHLGQIAAFGDRHYAVEKQTKNTATTSSLRLLASAERDAEIARLLAGEQVTGESLDAARSLVKEAEVLAA